VDRNTDRLWGYDPETIVSMLYRLLLGREPDPAGLAHHARNLDAPDFTTEELARTFIASDEFRRRPGLPIAAPLDLAADAPVRINALGCDFLLPAHSDVVEDLCSADGYEPWVLPYFLEFCQPGMTVLDIGASWGVFALPAARRVGPAGKVFAIEVSRWNCRILMKSIRASRLDNVQVLPFGVSDRLGSALLPIQRSTNNNVLNLSSDVSADSLDGYDVAPVMALDAIRATLGSVHIVKMDVEGMEYRTALGATSLLREQRPVVFSEYSPRFLQAASGAPGGELLRLFLNLGYRIEILHRQSIREIVPPGDSTAIIERVDEAWRQHVERDGGTHLDLCFHPHPTAWSS
jgi:FkbM family methyltransferase